MERYTVAPDYDDPGHWWIMGPTDVKSSSCRCVCRNKEFMDVLCANLNAAYDKGKEEGGFAEAGF